MKLINGTQENPFGYIWPMKNYLFILLSLCIQTTVAQRVELIDSSQKASFRGLSVVSDKVVWVSGSAGTVGLSTDGGNTWKWVTVKGFGNTDFRDIEAFDKKTAIIMGISSPAYILKTTDGGDTWKVAYENKDSSMFLDAMEFWNDMSGIVIGDPRAGRFFIARTFDGSNTWQTIPAQNEPVAVPGEACFASSGTNIRAYGRGEAVFISGGTSSNFFKRSQKINLPLLQGKTTTGANSIAIKGKKRMIVVGGDFTKPSDTTGNCALSSDGGETWTHPTTPPDGYRSCVEYLNRNTWVTCGLTGVDISNDNGMTWRSLSRTPFHVVRKAKKGKAVFLAGGQGRIGKIVQ